jgi:hypothetical protein
MYMASVFVRRADHSSRGALPTVMRRVWSRNLMNEETWAPVGAQRRKKKRNGFCIWNNVVQ